MSGGGKGGGSETNSQSSSSTQTYLPPYITGAQQDLLGSGWNQLGPFLQNNPMFSTMGLTPDQYQANELTRQLVEHQFSNQQRPPAYDVFGMGQQWMDPVAAGMAQVPNVTVPQINQLASQAQAKEAQQREAIAAQLQPGQIAPFLNPYLDAALDPALDRLRNQQGQVQADIGAQAAAAHAYGGGREAIMRAQADKNYREKAAELTGQMYQQGFDRAAALAGANTDRAQQAAMANAQLGTQVNLANAENDLRAQLANLQAGTTMQQAGLQAGLQGSIANAQLGRDLWSKMAEMQYQGSQADANRFLAALQQESGLRDADVDRQMKLINLLNQFGTQTRNVGQQSISTPFDMLMRLAQVYGPAFREFESIKNQQEMKHSETEQKASLGGILSGVLGLMKGF